MERDTRHKKYIFCFGRVASALGEGWGFGIKAKLPHFESCRLEGYAFVVFYSESVSFCRLGQSCLATWAHVPGDRLFFLSYLFLAWQLVVSCRILLAHVILWEEALFLFRKVLRRTQFDVVLVALEKPCLAGCVCAYHLVWSVRGNLLPRITCVLPSEGTLWDDVLFRS